MKKKLTIKQERFAQEYVSLGNASAAYRKVYDASNMTDEAICVSASRLKAQVWLRIQEIQKNEAEAYSMTRAEVIRRWTQIATADVNEVIQIRRESCKHCYEGEKRPAPNKECRQCKGTGESQIYIEDTRNLTGAVRMLYAGARKTKDGVEVILRDQDAALTNIARALGIFERPEDKPSIGPQLIKISEKTSDPIEAARIYKQIMLS